MIMIMIIVLLETEKPSLLPYFFAATPLDGYTMFFPFRPRHQCHYIQPDVYILLEKSMANSATFAA
jgi:hypothetical protein